MEKFIAQAEKEDADEIPLEAEDSEDEERAMALLYGDVSDSDVVADEEDDGENDEETSDDEEKPAFGCNLGTP